MIRVLYLGLIDSFDGWIESKGGISQKNILFWIYVVKGKMRTAGTVTAAKTLERLPRQSCSDPAFILPFPSRGADHALEDKSRAAEQVVDMPSWPGHSPKVDPDVPRYPAQSARTLG